MGDVSTSDDIDMRDTAPRPQVRRHWSGRSQATAPAPVSTLESLADRLERLRAERGLSERELAERAGIGTNQYQRIARVRTNPSFTALLGLASALDVSVAELLESNAEPLPILGTVQALLNELRWRRARWAHTERRFNNALERLLERLNQEGALHAEQSPKRPTLDHAQALVPSLVRHDTLRACASRYARLVLERCQGNKREACRELGITYHTLQAHLRYPADGDRVKMESAPPADT